MSTKPKTTVENPNIEMPSELVSEQMLLLVLVLTGSLVGAEAFKAFDTGLKTIDLSLGYQKLSYFFDLIGYAYTYQLNIIAALPPGTSLFKSSGDLVYLKVNGTLFQEKYEFPVFSTQIENTSCIEISVFRTGVIVTQSDMVNCVWPQS